MSEPPWIKSEEKNLGGKAYLVKKLGERGMSRRQALRVLNEFLDAIKQALARGEDVEFAYGKLTRVEKHFSKWWDAVHDWPANRQGYTVEWEPSPEGRERLWGPLGKEDRAYFEAIWQAPAPEKRECRGGKKGSRLIGK